MSNSGRQLFIIKEALAIAIAAIDAAPSLWKPLSDQHDMKRQLDELVSSDSEIERLLIQKRKMIAAIAETGERA